MLQRFRKCFNVSRNASTPQGRSQKALQRLKISFKASNLASTSQKTPQGLREKQSQAAAKFNTVVNSIDTSGIRQVLNTSNALNGSDTAYWSHYRDIVSKLQESPDCSRIDATIGVRIRVTGHSQDEIRDAIERNAPAMRRESMGMEPCESKYRERDWNRYAAEMTNNFIFGPRGTILHGVAQDELPLYLRLEGRSMAQVQQEGQRKYRGR